MSSDVVDLNCHVSIITIAFFVNFDDFSSSVFLCQFGLTLLYISDDS